MTMTDEPTTDVAADAPAGGKGKKGKKAKKDKGGKSNLVPALVLAAGLAAGGYFMGGGGGAAAPVDAEVVEEPEPEVLPGETVEVESMSLNLAGGHYLKIGVAVQLVEGISAEEFHLHEVPKIRDLIIATAGGRDMEELSTAAGREALKAELLRGAQELHEEEVYDLFLTELVMQ